MSQEPTSTRPPPEETRSVLVAGASVHSGSPWDAARAELDGLPGGRGLNMAYEAADRHAAGPRRDQVAVRCLGRRGDRLDVTYGELADASSRFAHGLDDLGVPPGELVYLLLGRGEPLVVATLGTLKHRNVLAPLFPAYGPEPVRQRITVGDGRVLVTTPTLYRHAVASVRDQLGSLSHVLVAAGTEPLVSPPPDGTLDLDALLTRQASHYDIPPTTPDDPALVYFTSGTTGPPKGAVHVHDAVVSQVASAHAALDLRAEDVFWCTADPGSPAATTYGVVAPLVLGATTILDEGDLDADHWYSVLEEEGVSVWYTTPTALRVLRRAGPEAARSHDLSRLRFVATTGELLDPELMAWAADVFGLPVHDTWWQTETGGIMIASPLSGAVRPGALGRPLPGVDVAVLERNRLGAVTAVPLATPTAAPTDAPGELALRTGWPSMFRAYLGDDARYRSRFVDGWYLTGDLARQDAAGYVWFVGRGDDAIDSAGHLVGPYEVESVLLQHPAVAEVGVVGVPDPAVGETVAAFVSLRPGVAATTELEDELLGFARRQLGPGTAPRRITFTADLPHTDAGGIAHSLLRSKAVTLAQRSSDGSQASVRAAR
ncbi:MAG: AMP-binding protein [Acidimicrobiales bacterium]